MANNLPEAKQATRWQRFVEECVYQLFCFGGFFVVFVFFYFFVVVLFFLFRFARTLKTGQTVTGIHSI